MVSLLFSDITHLVHECERLAKIREFVCSRQVVFVHHIPPGKLFLEIGELLAFERRNSATAGNARLAGQISHRIFLVEFDAYLPTRRFEFSKVASQTQTQNPRLFAVGSSLRNSTTRKLERNVVVGDFARLRRSTRRLRHALIESS